MNILIPHTWLLEHLETTATPDQIQKYVSLSGPSIERIYDREGEPVYDIEITTNRVDSMCVRGIARECAVILTQAGIKSPLISSKAEQSELVSGSSSLKLPFPVITNTVPSICRRTLGIILTNVQQSATPEWMAKRLRQTDQNVHNSIIDITNYVTHELGHPCHAFDYDKIMKLGGEIIIKQAEKGKNFTTLDGLEYETAGGEIVFENSQGEIIDLPAVMGTANTAVDEKTQNILL